MEEEQKKYAKVEHIHESRVKKGIFNFSKKNLLTFLKHSCDRIIGLLSYKEPCKYPLFSSRLFKFDSSYPSSAI